VLRHQAGNARAARRPRGMVRTAKCTIFSIAALEPAPCHARYGVAQRGDTAMLALSDVELCAVCKAFDRAWDNFLRTGALTPKTYGIREPFWLVASCAAPITASGTNGVSPATPCHTSAR